MAGVARGPARRALVCRGIPTVQGVRYPEAVADPGDRAARRRRPPPEAGWPLLSGGGTAGGSLPRRAPPLSRQPRRNPPVGPHRGARYAEDRRAGGLTAARGLFTATATAYPRRQSAAPFEGAT